MANHGFISSKRKLDKDKVFLDLQEINNRRFGGKLEIKIEDSEWFIHYPTEHHEDTKGFWLWLKTSRKLEHRHAVMWAYYLEIVFAHELATKYNGNLSDEGIGETWKPDVTKYPNYKAWIDRSLSHIKNPAILSKLENFHWETCPPDMVDY